MEKKLFNCSIIFCKGGGRQVSDKLKIKIKTYFSLRVPLGLENIPKIFLCHKKNSPFCACIMLNKLKLQYYHLLSSMQESWKKLLTATLHGNHGNFTKGSRPILAWRVFLPINKSAKTIILCLLTNLPGWNMSILSIKKVVKIIIRGGGAISASVLFFLFCSHSWWTNKKLMSSL